jgi:hypothetical protein
MARRLGPSLDRAAVALEAAGGFGLPLSLDESFERLLQIFIAGLLQSVPS